MLSDEPEGYQTYLLRLWSVQIQGRRQWRASIECPHTGERELFPNLEQCFAFLRDRCGSQTTGELDEERRAMEGDTEMRRGEDTVNCKQ